MTSQESKCYHCTGTGKCRFAKLQFQGAGDNRSYWFACFICAEGDHRFMTDTELPAVPVCWECKGTGVTYVSTARPAE